MNEKNTIELNPNRDEFTSEPLKRTNFFVSFCYLFFQVLLPGLVLFLLTSRDFTFAFQLPVSMMIVLSIVLLGFAIIATFITYKLKLHRIDQFTYVVPFVFFIIGLYLTSCWLNYHYFLVRFIIGFACAIVGILFTSVILVFVLRRKKAKE